MTSDIGAVLRELREAGGMEAKAVARSAAMSASKLSRIETGKATPAVLDVERILAAVGVSDEVRAELLAVARKAATEAVAWRLCRRTGFARHQDAIKAIEAGTETQRIFQPSCVPGLVQTPEYVRAVLARKNLTEDMLSRTVGARMERQRVLFEAEKTFRFVVAESVLRWRLVSSPEMAMQLDRLIAVSRLANVWIGVVPLSADMGEVPTSSFAVYDRRLAIVEVPHAEITTREPRDIDVYLAKFERFVDVSLAGNDMRSFVAGIRDEFLR
ncbi:helix-turn-helix domain-containing protein [Streptomyces sp. NBC_01498]|uniref:helix-turn-helix domain-containing protein n=1 Tax=Streptomyces sp. NBC_01498 TaxID=2975870 RepID=UPI002E7C06C6|nr:helix-turn-helix transcriptional regulator [Streptomyces sp. NBC_01498]WTL26899.1 helix-turn-helix domain-containing protein [Streptomyces sp. NBC_01498]